MAAENSKSMNFMGDAYETFHGRFSRSIGKAFAEWLNPPGDKRWLDVGCGTGAASAVILSYCNPKEIVGIDLSDSQVDYAATHNDDDRVYFQTGNAQELPFEDDSFDVAVAALMLNLVPNADAVLAEMKRVVRPGGTICTYNWDISADGHPGSPLVNGFRKLDPNAPGFGGGSVRVENRDDAMGLFERAGLGNIETKSFDLPIRYDSFDDYWANEQLAQGPMGAYLRGLSERQVDELKRILRDDLSAVSDAGGVEYQARAWGTRGLVP